jgi:hypothetical protein
VRVPSLFRRKSADVTDATPAGTPVPDPATGQSKGYTPSKRELGKETPKRATTQRRRVVAKAPENRREAYKQMRERQRAERAEATAGMKAGDERYLLARDRGPERSLVRDLVDSRRTVGTFFFGGALLVLIGSQPAMPVAVQVATNVIWLVLAVGVVLDSVLIARRIKTRVSARFPKTDQRMGSLYMYGIMRGLTFRRMRVPKPKVNIGDKV